MIAIEGLAFGYNGTEVLRGVSFRVEPGEIVSVIGPNGSGKTTLLRCLGKIVKPSRGVVSVQGKDLSTVGLRDLSKMMATVHQSETDLFPLTVFDTVLMGRRPHIGWRVKGSDLEVVSEVMRRLNLDELRNRFVDELSGGERQRVLIARALAQEPSVMLLDEPTSNLDPRHQLEVFELITDLAARKGIAIVCAIHDLHLAARFSHTVVMLKGGRVAAAGPPECVITASNLRSVYGIEAFICTNGGCLHVVPRKAS